MKFLVLVLCVYAIEFGYSNAAVSLNEVFKTGWQVYAATSGENHIIDQLKLIGNQLRLVENVRLISNIAADLEGSELQEIMIDLSQSVFSTDKMHRRMRKYVRDVEKYNKNTLIKFSKSVITHGDGSIISLADKIHSFIVQINKNTTLSEIKRQLENRNDFVCAFEESPNQILHNFFVVVASTEIKIFTLVQFSYVILNLHGNEIYRQEREDNRKNFRTKLLATMKESKAVLAGTSVEIWKCDPERHVEGDTFVQFTNFMQGFVTQEQFLNRKHTCAGTCQAYFKTMVYNSAEQQNTPEDRFCRQQRCLGDVLSCHDMGPNADIYRSMSETRRYDYILYQNRSGHGRLTDTSRPKLEMYSKISWGYQCSFCLCFCDEETNSDRFVSMRSTLADMMNNKVVTGVRFAKKNQLIHLQIQDGNLKNHGQIDADTVRWVPVDNFTLRDRRVYRNQDYYRLTPEESEIYLDDVTADENHVVTGVRFKKISMYLVLEILITPYDYFTGRLIQPRKKSKWKDAITAENRKKVILEKPDIPTLVREGHPIYSKPHQYLQFTHTDVDKDLAQMTVPFFDAQPVTSTTPVAVVGVGIFHKGQKGSGGFLAPKLKTTNHAQHIVTSETDFTSNERDRFYIANKF